MAAGADGWDCEACRGRGTSWCDAERKWPGSLGVCPGPRWLRIPHEILAGLGLPGPGLLTCPLPMVPRWWAALARQVRAYRDGHLLVAGGVLAQPAAWLEAVSFASSCHDHYERKRLERPAGSDGSEVSG